MHTVTGGVRAVVKDPDTCAACGPGVRVTGQGPSAVRDYVALRNYLSISEQNQRLASHGPYHCSRKHVEGLGRLGRG